MLFVPVVLAELNRLGQAIDFSLAFLEFSKNVGLLILMIFLRDQGVELVGLAVDRVERASFSSEQVEKLIKRLG